MQPLTILALLVGSALAAAPGSVCNTNVECNANCINSKWTIAAQTDGSYRFVCYPTISDETQYYSSTCNKLNIFDRPYDKEATGVACAKVGGILCTTACVSSGEITSEIDFRNSWDSACGLVGHMTAEVDARDSEDLAKDDANCKRSGGGRRLSGWFGVGRFVDELPKSWRDREDRSFVMVALITYSTNDRTPFRKRDS
jgi:hypothetical protein